MHALARDLDREFNLGMPVALQENSLLADFRKILRFHRRLRHTGEGRKLVDHAAHVLDLAHDGVRAHREGLRVALDLFQVLAFQALRRKLDGGQGVLDLMGDAPGDVGPGRRALGGHQLRDIVEGDHVADDIAAKAFGRHAREKGVEPSLADELDLRLLHAVRALHDPLEKVRHLGDRLAQVLTDGLLQVDGQELRGRTVGQIDAPVDVQTDNAGGHTGEHGFHEPAPFVQLTVGLHQARLLAFQLAGHAVKGTAQGAQFVGAGGGLDAHAQVPFAHPFGGRDQVADGPSELGRLRHADPDGGQQQQQHHQPEDDHEYDLNVLEAIFQAFVLARRHLDAFDVVEDARVDEPPDQQVGVDEPVEPDHRAHAVLLARGKHDDFAPVGQFHGLRRGQFEFQRKAELGPGKNPAAAVHHQGLGQRAQRRLRRENLAEASRITHQRRRVAVQVVGHGEGVGANTLPVFMKVGAGHLLGLVERRAHPLVEPGFDAQVEEHPREHGDQDCRGHRRQTEKHHQPDVQARSRQPPAPLRPYGGEPPCHHHPQHEQQENVQGKKNKNGAGIGGAGRPHLGHRGHRRHPRRHGRRCQAKGQLAAQAGARRPQADARNARTGHWRRGRHFPPRTTGMFSSRIFLRSVFRLRPNTSAALIWLPRVACRVRVSNGRSTSFRTRS